LATETQLQILALVQSHKQTLIANTQMMAVEEVYLQDYDNYINDLERETDENLQRFRIPQSAIKSSQNQRWCEKSYFLGQLDALIRYIQSPPPDWPSRIVD
jgi:hypothetical protein